jgi:ribonuclease R
MVIIVHILKRMNKSAPNINKLKQRTEKIFAANRSKAYNYKQISAMLDLNSNQEREAIIKILKLLEKDGQIEEVAPGKYAALYISHFVEGRMQLTQRGSGFLIPDAENLGDIFIENEYLNTALHGDKVKVHLFAHKVSGKSAGEVVEVIERNKNKFVGVVQLAHNYAFVVPDDHRMYVDIFVPLPKLNKAKNGDKVVAAITEWDSNQKNPFGEVLEVLGKPGEHQTEMHAIINEFGFSVAFPESVEQEAEKIPIEISKEEIKKRRDFRNTLTFTIDPDDAKDFDDALSIKPLDNGLWEIGVHIADVSHYVTQGSKLDAEAYNRATSVYLVDRTIPMLPEKLSNGVCSLRPHEEKLTFSTVFTMNEKAEVVDTWIGKTIIYSDRRFTYEEAQLGIETGEGDYAAELQLLNKLALILRESRFKHGAVNFETEEVKFKLDENFKPTEIFKKIRKDAHKLIEEFMLLSNRTVAKWADSLGKGDKKKTFVYRVHEPPNEEKLKIFSMFASRFGYSIRTNSERAIAQSFNQLLEEVEGKPEQNIIQSMAVRSMMKAYYTTKKTSHYGLAFDHYTHFTSPIRRYPDLMVHRLLHSYQNKGKSGNEADYEERCKHSSQMEVQAADAERASVKYKQVEYIKDFIGHQFTGIISGVTEWGMYVEITEYKCEGMIRLSNLADDYYEFDEYNQWIIGRNTRKTYQLGNQVEVIVKNADTEKRQIDLDLVDNLIRTRIAKKSSKHKAKEERRKKAVQKATPKQKKKRRR